MCWQAVTNVHLHLSKNEQIYLLSNVSHRKSYLFFKKNLHSCAQEEFSVCPKIPKDGLQIMSPQGCLGLFGQRYGTGPVGHSEWPGMLESIWHGL